MAKAADKKKQKPPKEKKRKTKVYCVPIAVCLPPKPKTTRERITYFFSRMFKGGWQLIGIIVTVSGLWVVRDIIHNALTPREKLWKEKTYVDGISIPKKTLENYNKLIIVFGSRYSNQMGYSQEIPIDVLKDTATFLPTPGIIMPGGDTPFNFKFLLKKNKLYLATIFKDIDGKYVGKMDFTNWELKSTKISNYHDGDDNLEIIDENNYVLFNMRYLEENIILINGYFVGDNGVQVAGDKLFSGFHKGLPDYKEQAIKEIRRITPLNSY